MCIIVFRFDDRLLLSVGLFTLSVIDSLYASDNYPIIKLCDNGGDNHQLSGEDNSTLRLCIRILTAKLIHQTLNGMLSHP